MYGDCKGLERILILSNPLQSYQYDVLSIKYRDGTDRDWDGGAVDCGLDGQPGLDLVANEPKAEVSPLVPWRCRCHDPHGLACREQCGAGDIDTTLTLEVPQLARHSAAAVNAGDQLLTEKMIRIFAERGQAALQQEKEKEAAKLFKEALRLDPDSQKVFLALLELKLKRHRVNDIVDLSKTESGKLEIESIHMDLGATVEEVATLLGEQAHSKGLEFNCFIASTAPIAVLGDPTRFRQVLTNLINNAIKFTEEGEVTARVGEGLTARARGESWMVNAVLRTTRCRRAYHGLARWPAAHGPHAHGGARGR